MIVWVTKDLAAPRTGRYSWMLAGTSETYWPYVNLHCVVLTGWARGVCTVAGPLCGERTWDWAQFSDSFLAMGSRAVVLHG